MSRVIDTEQLKPCLEYGLDLIPIRKWNSKSGEPPKASGKMPRDKDWVVAHYTKTDILGWIKKGGNIGVRLRSDELVVDIDPRHKDAQGRSAQEIVEEMELELGINLMEAPCVRTGSGGLHLYFKKPSDQRVRNCVELFGGCVEFKSHGRQVLAPGCKHPNGSMYEWERNAGAPINPCPSELWETIAKPVAGQSAGEGDLSLEQIKGCLSQMDPTAFRDYDAWRDVMFAVHFASGGDPDACEVFVKWSTADAKYAHSGEKIRMFWENADCERSGGRTERTLYWHVLKSGGTIPINLDSIDEVEQPPSANGEDKPELPMPVFDRDTRSGRIKHTIAENVILACQYLGLGVREDIFSGKRYLIDSQNVLQGAFGLSNGSELVDRSLELMALAITREIPTWTGDPGSATIKRAKEALLIEDNPLQRYLNGLEWDGKERLETWLIECSDLIDNAYNRAVSRLFLLAAVGRALCPGIKFDTMVILEGPQGGYKSTLIRWMAGQWSAEGLPPIGGHHYKDVVGAMRGRWLIEIEELASMTKSDVNYLKAFLSRTEDRVRLPYEQETRTFPRQCIFVGTTNDYEYLRDFTGNRRFLPLKVGNIHNILEIPRDQLWAEAVHEWRENPDRKEITLPRKLWGKAGQEQELRRIRDPWEDRVGEFLETKFSGQTELTTEQLFFDILRIQSDKATSGDARRLSQVMQKHGWRAGRIRTNDGRQVRGYLKGDPQ